MQSAWIAVLICAPLQKKLGKLHGFSPHLDIKEWWQVYHWIDVCEVSTWLMSHASVDLHPQYKGHNTGKQLHAPLWVWSSYIYAACSQLGFCKWNPWYISVNPGSVGVSVCTGYCFHRFVFTPAHPTSLETGWESPIYLHVICVWYWLTQVTTSWQKNRYWK